MGEESTVASELPKCACVSCHCPVMPERAVTRGGKLYCSQTCAYDCSDVTCVCVHESCGDDVDKRPLE